MRKVFFILLIILVTTGITNAQMWMDFGAKGAYGTNWLLNSKILKDPDFEHDFSMGGGFGGKVGWNFSNKIELTAEVMYAFFNQSYTVINESLSKTWKQKIQFSTIDFPILLRFNPEGSYIELGAQYSLMQNAKESNTGGFASLTNPDQNLEASYMSGVIGFGRWIATGASNFNLALGIRFTYGFNDIVNDNGGKGESIFYPANRPEYSKIQDGYAPTNPMTVRLVLEFNYDLAYIMDARCHRTSGR